MSAMQNIISILIHSNAECTTQLPERSITTNTILYLYCIQYILIARNIALYALLLGTVNNNIKWVALSDKCGVSECVNIGWHMTHQLTLSEGASHVESQSYITVLQREFIYQGIFHTVWEIISDTKIFHFSNVNPIKLCWREYVQCAMWD